MEDLSLRARGGNEINNKILLRFNEIWHELPRNHCNTILIFHKL